MNLQRVQQVKDAASEKGMRNVDQMNWDFPVLCSMEIENKRVCSLAREQINKKIKELEAKRELFEVKPADEEGLARFPQTATPSKEIYDLATKQLNELLNFFTV